ncbi:MAG: D-Ala-D-Ala carboxypeptidase family metallohydrolase [Candidatus Pacebacteria bacterium]|nr:D-Ala-D-Ala carboxypeptidase family metallohydrolase [Candidatus Paceibacterota bacterium]
MKHLYTTLALLILITAAPQVVLAATEAECTSLGFDAYPSTNCNEDTLVTDTDRALGVTSQVADAKAYLLSVAKDLRGSKAPPTCPANIHRLNNTFAVCLSRFIKAANSEYGEGAAILVSAFRSPDSKETLQNGCGNNAAAGGSKTSNHMYGRAADIIAGNGINLETLRAFTEANPQLGVCFPYVPLRLPGAYNDPWHMALAGIDTGEARACARQGITSYCNQSPQYDPNQDRVLPTSQSQSDTTGSNYKTPPQSVYGTSQYYSPHQYQDVPYAYKPTSYQEFVSNHPDSYSDPIGISLSEYEEQDSAAARYGEHPTSEPQYVASKDSASQPISDTAPTYKGYISTLKEKVSGVFNPNTSQSPPTSTYESDTYYIVPTISDGWHLNKWRQESYQPSFTITESNYTQVAPYIRDRLGTRPPDWIDNSFYEEQEQVTQSWWQRLLGVFGF